MARGIAFSTSFTDWPDPFAQRGRRQLVRPWPRTGGQALLPPFDFLATFASRRYLCQNP